MPEGVIQKLNAAKGFGFVGPKGSRTGYFFHMTKLARGYRFDQLVEGQLVSFELAPSRKDPTRQDAVDVVPMGIATRSSSMPSPFPPYRFAPIDINLAVTDSLVWHDGSGGGDILSGEILCTLEALTPLLPGNARYTVGEADASKLKQWGFTQLSEKKQIAEPLRPPDGRVVIAGSALKGMLRHSLGALLSAPMERVAEKHYTYRPNLDFGKNEKIVARPALVIGSQNGGWTIDILGDARAAIFVRSDAEPQVGQHARGGSISGSFSGLKLDRNRLVKGSSTDIATLAHRVASYQGGIDGTGLFATAFEKSKNANAKGPFTYRMALVPDKGICQLEIPAELFSRYLDDQKRVLANSDVGHLNAHPLEIDAAKVARAIRDNATLSIGQLIYVEVTLDANSKLTSKSRVLSFGHHFRYRWACTSSVRQKHNIPRESLTPTTGERKDKPSTLTGTRLLFGYVRNEDTPIGKGVFERLAGRVAINNAVSIGVPEFLNSDKGCCVPLKILGQPKPSAWEFYLQQEGNRPCTYGDLPDNAGGDLAGRKFYLHQPGVKGVEHIAAQDDETICSDHATLARFICAPETKFRFTIRFARLRHWELGALLATLQPHRLDADGSEGQYAHKLGLGRPLGMGSVMIRIDKLHARLESATDLNDTTAPAETALDALLNRLGDSESRMNQISRWLELHEFIDRGPLDYPRNQQGEIFGWHTDLRRKYSKLRRESNPDGSFLDMMNEAILPAHAMPTRLTTRDK